MNGAIRSLDLGTLLHEEAQKLVSSLSIQINADGLLTEKATQIARTS